MIRRLSSSTTNASSLTPKIITISEEVWRAAASKHSQEIKSLLEPGLLARCTHNRNNRQQYHDDWTSLDHKNPIYNFLIEYYGLKGAKGPRRLARWAPNPQLLLSVDSEENNESSNIQTTTLSNNTTIYKAAMEASNNLGGILLENASLDDLGGTLHMRGSVPVPITKTFEQSSTAMANEMSFDTDITEQQLWGILFHPAIFVHNKHTSTETTDSSIATKEQQKYRKQQILQTMAPFQWYASILRTTLNSEPILHCYGLHEWAMQYHPHGADPPPSAKYQSSLNLRVSREVINDTVERKGIRCSHVDALRFFAPAAGPLNHHGATLERLDQLRLEQKGCVHAHMDLLKIGLKLQSFIDPELMVDILEVALSARKLDVEASPYDATKYGAGIVPIETNEGRRMYRERQIVLMQKAEPVRKKLLHAYEDFMKLAFDEELVFNGGADDDTAPGDTRNGEYVAPERLARAQPGGLPWRKNLIDNN